MHRTFSCAAAFAALVLFAAISRGSAQVKCFTTPSSAGELHCGSADGEFNATSIEECCLSPTGQFFEDPTGSAGCTACIVFEWLDGRTRTEQERTDTYRLQAAFTKGAAVQTFATSSTLASLVIIISEGTAEQGVNEDFIVPDTTHSLFGSNPILNVDVTLRLDGIALEPDEDFTLSLAGVNENGIDLINGTTTGLFVFPEIRVVIQDLERVSLQFTEIDYSRVELERFIQPQLQLSTVIATDLVVDVIPLNLTFARNNNQLPTSIDPELTDPNFDPSTQTATSGEDFSILPVRITFANGSSQTIGFDMEIIDDTIHEADQVYVFILDVISAVDRNRFVPERADGLTSLGRIIDDDSIVIGFVQERYTVSEEFDATGDLFPIAIIKGNNQQSELEFDVIAQFIDDTATLDEDYLTLQRVVIPFVPAEQIIQVEFILIQDRIPESSEEFSIELTSQRAPRVTIGQMGGPFSSATVVIVDDDELTIGWERNLTIVNETQGPLELCLIIRDVNEFDILTGFSVMLFVGTVRGTAADPGDYTELRSDTLFVFITDENRRVCIDVNIIDDTLLEEVEFFSVQVVPGPDGLSDNIQLDPDLTFVEILDNDFVRIGFNQTTYTVTEGVDDVATVYVAVLGGGLQRTVSVTFSTDVLSSDTATADVDFISLERVLVFDENTLVVPVDIEITDDNIVEFLETFTVSLFRDPDDPINEVIIDPDTATVFIRDGDVLMCLEPPLIVNGMRTFTGLLVNDTATYTCDPGFELVGEPITTCTAAGDGTSATYPAVPPPECRPLCDVPPLIVNGMRTFTGVSVGNTATYSCDTGFELIGIATTTCTAAADGNSATYPAVPPPECRPLCPDPPDIPNGMFTCDGNTIDDTCTYTCNTGFELIGPAGSEITTCTRIDVDSAEFSPTPPPPICQPIGEVIKVNDTVIGDPVFAVPVFVPDLEDLDIAADSISLCYEIHGESNEWFNFVTDECTSVNALYTGIVGEDLNVISQIGIRAVDTAMNCREILVNLDGCSVELDGMPLNTSRYTMNEITIRHFTMMRRVRVTVPNCQEQSVVMWITCQTRTAKSTVSNDLITFESLRLDVMRGLNFGHRDSHGLIGQFWNVPVQLSPFNGILRDGSVLANDYIVTVTRNGSPQRAFVGHLGSRTWDRSSVPCLYSGNRQAGPIYEVLDPNDPVIEGNYRFYRVPSAFDEGEYRFGRFEENTC